MPRRSPARRKRTVQIAEGVETKWECGRCHIPAMPDATYTQIDPRYSTGVCTRCGDRAMLVLTAAIKPIRQERVDAPS